MTSEESTFYIWINSSGYLKSLICCLTKRQLTCSPNTVQYIVRIENDYMKIPRVVCGQRWLT